MTALEKMGMKGHKRYPLTLAALELIIRDERLLTEACQLYCVLGSQLQITPASVARQIHTLACCAWETNRTLLEQIAGYSLPRPPATGEFLAMLYVDYKLGGK